MKTHRFWILHLNVGLKCIFILDAAAVAITATALPTVHIGRSDAIPIPQWDDDSDESVQRDRTFTARESRIRKRVSTFSFARCRLLVVFR
jgi:hypothetical protein